MNNNKIINIGVAQYGFKDAQVEENLDKGTKYLVQAAEEGMDLILLPEMFTTGFPLGKNMDDFAENIEDSNTMKHLSQQAKAHNISVVGSFAEWDKHLKKSFNTGFFISREGILLSTYRKIQLFDKERNYVHPGRSLSVVEYDGIKYGILICFDIEFPEPARYLANAGAEVLLVVSNNMKPYGHIHRVFVQARAVENHMYVAYCNRTGTNELFIYEGESCIVTPQGTVTHQLGNQDEGLLTGTIDLQEVADSKKIYNYLGESATRFIP